MKRNKFLVSVVSLALCGAMVLSGCSSKKSNSKKGGKNNAKVEEDSKGNVDMFEALEKFSPDMQYDDVEKMIGFAGTCTHQKEDGKFTHESYEWELTSDTSVQATFYIDEEGKFVSSSMTADFYSKLIRDDDVDFSDLDKFEKKAKSDEGITYEECCKIFGAEGVLKEVSDTSKKYEWAAEDGGWMDVTFNSKGIASFYNGMT